MTASKRVLALCLFITLLSTANAVCTLVNPICNILLPLIPLCSLTQLIGLCGSNDLIVLQITSSEFTLSLNTNILGLTVLAGPSSSVGINLLGGMGDINISADLNLNGPVVVHVAAGAKIRVGGSVTISPSSIVDIAGNLTVLGNTIINGNLHLAGALSNSPTQTAWLSSSSGLVTVGGTPAKPGTITGNGGVDAPVVTTGNAATGENLGGASNVYFTKTLSVSSDSVFSVYGNATVEGLTTVNGRLHLGGLRTSVHSQTVWFNGQSNVQVEGTVFTPAKITGNGLVGGDVILGEYAGVAAGNSPGVQTFAGSLQMGATSFMEIEVEGTTGSQFDQYKVDNILHRNGILYINFLGGYFPNVNDRFNFASHFNATGSFNTVYTNSNEVVAAYSLKSTAFVYRDPISPSYCTCTVVN